MASVRLPDHRDSVSRRGQPMRERTLSRCGSYQSSLGVAMVASINGYLRRKIDDDLDLLSVDPRLKTCLNAEQAHEILARALISGGSDFSAAGAARTTKTS